jgi:hypothetical protein
MSHRRDDDGSWESDGLPTSGFTQRRSAIEGVDDPEEQEVRVICVDTGEVVGRSTETEYESSCN